MKTLQYRKLVNDDFVRYSEQFGLVLLATGFVDPTNNRGDRGRQWW